MIADLLARPEAFGRGYHLAGAGTISTREFVATVERATGKRIKLLAVNKTLLRLLGTVSPLMREIADMYYLFTDPLLLDDSALRAVLPQLRKTPYDIGIPATIAALREMHDRVAVHG